MNPGFLFKAVVFLCVTTAVAAPQNEHAPAPQVLAPAVQAPTPLPHDANEYVSQAIEHELAAQKRDHTHWRYHLHREDEKNNVDRDVIETSEGSLSRTLLMWGKPLTAEQRQKDEERMRKQVSDPEERARIAKRDKEDDEKVEKMLRAIAQAFIFKYDGEDEGLVRLAFVPNPHYDPPSLEQRIFRSLNGKLWIDRAANRLAGIDGTLFEDVSFGWGLLGRLYKGGTFKVVQKDVGDGHWDVVSEEVNMVGRAVLFKTINRKQNETLTDFRRVPDSLTMSQAYQMLQKDSSSVSANNQNSAELQPPGKN